MFEGRYSTKYESANYVPANMPVENKQAPTQESVSAQVNGNIAGGIGASAIVFAAWLIAHGALHSTGIVADAWPNMLQVLVASAVFGLLVFGVLMFVRNSVDEVFDAAAKLEAETYIKALESAVELRDAEIVRLKAELDSANVLVNVRQLQSTGPVQRMVPAQKQLSPAWNDAYNLIIRKWNGQSWARDAMRQAGWTDKRHADATDILKRCGIAVDGGKQGLQPWDANATVTQALAVFQRARATTLGVLNGVAGSVADAASDADTDSDATSDTKQGRGGESWQPTGTDV